MKIELQWLCNELIGAAATGGAQGLAVIALVWLALKCCPRANAATRHAALFATLMVVTLLPVALLGAAIWERLPSRTIADEAAVELPAYVPELAPIEESFAEFNRPENIETVADELPEPWNWAVALPEKVSLGLAAVWLFLAVTRLGGLACQLWFLRKLKRQGSEAPQDMQESFAAVLAGMRVSRKAWLLISEKCPAPMVVGFFHPAMLLPKFVATQATAGQLEHLFRHELAHLARRDDWTNLAQQIIAAIFFFHPGILFLSRRLTTEREIACDDHALAISRAPREYALFLTEFASQMKGRDFTAAPAAWSRKSQLKERIGMILNGKRNASPRVSRAGVGAIAAAALGLAAGAVIAMPRLSVAAEEPAANTIVAVAPKPASEPQVATTVELAALSPIAPIKVHVPEVRVNVEPRPVPVAPVAPRIVAAAPAPEPQPRPRFKSRDNDEDDDNLERRLDRLERMVEDLLRRNTQGNIQNPGAKFKTVPDEMHAHIRTEIEHAHREADRARREVDRAMRDQQRSAESQARAMAQGERSAKIAHNQSLKARKQSLQERRKQLEKEIEAVDKEIEREEKAREKSEKDEEKEDKKGREKNKPDADGSDFKPKQ